MMTARYAELEPEIIVLVNRFLADLDTCTNKQERIARTLKLLSSFTALLSQEEA
jgi:hypothetical protein